MVGFVIKKTDKYTGSAKTRVVIGKKTGEQVFVRGGVSGWWQRGGREERRERGRDVGLGRRGGDGEIERPEKKGKRKKRRKRAGKDGERGGWEKENKRKKNE